MLQTMYTFSALSLAGTMVLALLPQGSLRKTASMVIGLLTLMCWAESCMALFSFPPDRGHTGHILTPTHMSIVQAEAAAAAAILEEKP